MMLLLIIILILRLLLYIMFIITLMHLLIILLALLLVLDGRPARSDLVESPTFLLQGGNWSRNNLIRNSFILISGLTR